LLELVEIVAICMIYRFFESLTYKDFTARFSPYYPSLAIIFGACLGRVSMQ